METVEHKNGLIVMNRTGELAVLDDQERERYRYNVPYGVALKVLDGAKLAKGQSLFEWDPYNNVILATKAGSVELIDLIEGETTRDIYDERTGVSNIVVVEHREKKLHPSIQIFDADKKRLASLTVPAGSYLQVKDGDMVVEGDILVKMPRETSKSKDITGGLPRVAELFEARRPKDAAVVSENDGIVEFGGTERGNRKIVIRDDQGAGTEYLIPLGKHLRIHEGDRVRAGDRMSEGAIDPHDILRIMGENAVQRYLLDEIQSVYRLQGVTINDKHIEVIVTQMLRKVKIEKPGDTRFLIGDDVDKRRLREENEMVIAEGGEPATFKPMLLGITRASLDNRVVSQRGVVPGNHQGALQGGGGRQGRPSQGAEGKLDIGQPDSRGHGLQTLSRRQNQGLGRRHRAGRGARSRRGFSRYRRGNRIIKLIRHLI